MGRLNIVGSEWFEEVHKEFLRAVQKKRGRSGRQHANSTQYVAALKFNVDVRVKTIPPMRVNTELGYRVLA
jgi:hypothetical protein